MDFMKVFDQAVREIKREVNLKVLKVPEIEQKVMDATDNEPWGPHGSEMSEIAQATKKFTECQMVMNVLWSRLAETGKDWRYVYKALAVIEFLVSHGSERAVDEIIEHTFQISALTSFEYVEPNGKDCGINVRKKAENIVNLLNNRDKIQEIREKASANRDKYVGLSSSGITYKSGTSSFGSAGSRSGDRYGGFSGSRDNNSFRDSNRDKGRSEDLKSPGGFKNEDQGYVPKRHSSRLRSKDQENMSSKQSDSDKYSSVKSSGVPSKNQEDDFDDFDPRGTSTKKPPNGNSSNVDLFGQSLFGDLMDAPTSGPTEASTMHESSSQVDLFADAAFVSAPPQPETRPSSLTQKSVDLFAFSPPAAAGSPKNDLFASPDPVIQPQANSPRKSEQTTTNIFDPFAAVPLNNFDGSDPFGSFTSHSDTVSTDAAQYPVTNNATNDSDGATLFGESKSPVKKDPFQVKSGIWADSLSRGLIDLNITAPKKVSLADVGIVGLGDGSEDNEKGPPTSFYMGQAMGTGSGLSKTGIPTSQSGGAANAIPDDFFSNLGSQQQYQFGNFQK